MSQIICPKCGGHNTSLVANRSKHITVSPGTEPQPPRTNDDVITIPVLYCHDCQTDFGGDYHDRVANTRQIVLNTYQKGAASQNLTFSKTATGATIEGPFLCYYPDLPEIYIDHHQWRQLLEDFYKLYITDWKTAYGIADDPNDFGWDLKIICTDHAPFITSGQGCYPPYWTDMMDLFVSFGLPNIGNKLGQNFLQLQTH